MKILIAEDSTLYRMMIQSVVEELGHEYLLASDGQEAWEVFQEFGADVIISDWIMPRLDGPSLCRRVRAHGGGRYTYFILLTSREEKEDFLAGMQAGADDYLTKPLDRDNLEVRLIAASRVTSLHQQLSDRNAEMERLNGALFDSARTDPLTQLGNRLRQWEDLEVLQGRVARYGHSYCVALCDIDHFKAYNDQYGHMAGDRALRVVAQVLAGQGRSGDAAYRYGGEEFLLILPEQSLETAMVGVNRVRLAVEDLAIPHAANEPFGVVTLSAGIAALRPADGPGSDALLARADAALYCAKRAGRNQVSIHEPALEPAR